MIAGEGVALAASRYGANAVIVTTLAKGAATWRVVLEQIGLHDRSA